MVVLFSNLGSRYKTPFSEFRNFEILRVIPYKI
jgi:hypothetical protein